MATVGFFHNGNSASFADHYKVFEARLHEVLGGKSVTIAQTWAADMGGLKPLQSHIQELIENSNADVIVAAGGPPSAQAAQQATLTRKTPVVFMSVADPHDLGLVGDDYNQPGTNMTGIAGMTSELDLVRLRILREFLDNLKHARIGVLNNAGRPLLDQQYGVLDKAAPGMSATLVPQDVTDLAGIKNAFQHFKSEGCDGVLVTADSLFNNLRNDVVVLANRLRLPAIYQWREFADAGGLMSFGPNIMEAYAKVGEYAALILKGASPAALPVSFPSRCELVINLATARASNFTVPAGLLGRAEFVQPDLKKHLPKAP